MLLIIVILLVLVCVVLALRLDAMERDLRSARLQLKERAGSGSTARLGLRAPHPAAEELLTEVNALMELRQEEKAEYRRREEAIRRQIANVSHDLRTPLTSILGYLQLLEDESLPKEERQKYLDIVKGRARTLQTLITSFYDLSRIEGGEYPLTEEKVDLYGVLSELLAEFYDDLQEAGLCVETALAEGLPPVWGDRAAVTRVFTNLVGNALNHGAWNLSIRLEPAGDRVRTVFSNGAPGMKEADVARVFDRFYTADLTRSAGGTGLGLAIVKALTEQMGHTVTASLEEGRFTVEIIWKADKNL